jgi:AraC-like DNA-binding protein
LLEQRVLAAWNHRQRASIVSQFILQRLTKTGGSADPVFNSIRQILFSSAALSVAELSDNCFLSRRQFERKFLHYAGNSPKQFQRIARFNAVIKGFEKRNQSLTKMAYDCGYYDQSHFIHDFRCFAGYSPKTFFRNQKDAADYRAFEDFSPGYGA